MNLPFFFCKSPAFFFNLQQKFQVRLTGLQYIDQAETDQSVEEKSQKK